MTLAAWPTTVNQRVMNGSYRESPEDAVDRFEVDHGPPLENSATSVPTVVISFETSLTSAEYSRLITFWRDDVFRVQPFTREHPRTGVPSSVFRFMEAPKLLDARFDKYRVSLMLRELP